MLRTAHHRDGSTRRVHLGGWKRQARDDRDFKLSIPQGFTALPPAFNLLPYCSDVEDQGDLGDCTGNGFAGIIELNERIAGAKLAMNDTAPIASLSNIQVSPSGLITFTTSVMPPAQPTPTPAPTPTPTPAPSKLIQVGRLAHYYFTRTNEGTTSEDSGATIRDTIKAGVQTGVSDEALWPYDITKYAMKPPAAVYTNAASHKVTSYHSIADGDINTMKAALYGANGLGNGIIFGFNVYSYFMTQDMATRAMLSVPQKGESLEGGHCVDIIGWDDTITGFLDGTTGGVLCRNSWGINWGLAAMPGYFWMSYSYLKKTGLASDFWVVLSQPFANVSLPIAA
jgi:hypothetical protein